MKKSLLFITLLTGAIALGVFTTTNNDSQSEQVANQAFNQKWKNKETKALGFFKYRQEMLKNVETGEINPQDYYKALKEVEALSSNNTSNKTSTLGMEWINRGPDSQGGRTRTMLFDKDDANLVFTGSVSGGLFKSTNAGNSWERVPGFFESNSAIMSLAQSQDGTIFVGTGETLGGTPNGGINNVNATGSGIYKSTDRGDTWTSIDATNEFTFPTFSGQWSSVRKMAAHPALANVLIAGNNSGLRISTNADVAQPTFSNISGVPGNVSDVKITEDGTDGWAAAGGRIYKSNGDLSNPWQLTSPAVGASRAQLAVSKIENNNYIVYASFTNGQGCLAGVFKTEDKGTSWTQIIFAGGLDPFAQPSSSGGLSGCQGWYDHCIAVSPVDNDKIYIGGITFYTWSSASGGLKRADQIDSEGAHTFDPDYIHADKHGIFFNPHDATGNTMFIVGDGGISRTLNAFTGFPDNMVYSENNKNYTTLQCYSIGSGKYGEVIAGAQDNGSQYVDYKGISPKASKEVSGGDGVAGAEISNFNIDACFTGIYYGNIKRSLTNGNSSSNFLSPVIDPGACGHITCSPTISPQTCDNKAQEGQTFIYPFLLMETFDRMTSKKDAYIYARDEIINLPGGQTVILKDTIESGEVIDHDQFVFQNIPNMDFEGLGLSFDLPDQLTPGDTHYFDNFIDSKYFVPSNCGNRLFVCTNPLQDGAAPIFNSVNVPGQSGIEKMDYSYDGDMVVGVAGGNLIVMTGWDAYDPDSSSATFNMNSVVSKTIPIGVGNIRGVAVDKSNKDRVLVTQAGYGGVTKVFLVTDVTSNSPVVTGVQGDLPIMPTYSCVIDKENGDRFIVGTELGIFASNDGGATWTEENEGMGARIPVFVLRQKWVNNFDCYLLSAGSLGGGMYTCESLSSCAGNIQYGRPEPNGISELPTVEVNNVLVYPNPVEDIAKIAFILSEASDITIRIVDLTGKEVLSKEYKNLSTGEQSLEMNVSSLATSSYFTVISTGNKTFGNKLFIKK